MAVDYSRGYPQYRPEARGIMSSAPRAALLVGSLTLDDPARTALSHVSTIAVGPRASEAGLGRSITIDTGVAGIHESGSAYRMDEVPLTLRAPLPGPRSATEVLLALKEVIRRELEERPG
jgi:formylmethanofuran dehydrogenase subunit B